MLRVIHSFRWEERSNAHRALSSNSQKLPINTFTSLKTVLKVEIKIIYQLPLWERINLAWIRPYRSIAAWYTYKKLNTKSYTRWLKGSLPLIIEIFGIGWLWAEYHLHCISIKILNLMTFLFIKIQCYYYYSLHTYV